MAFALPAEVFSGDSLAAAQDFHVNGPRGTGSRFSGGAGAPEAALTFMARDFHATEVPQDSGEEKRSD